MRLTMSAPIGGAEGTGFRTSASSVQGDIEILRRDKEIGMNVFRGHQAQIRSEAQTRIIDLDGPLADEHRLIVRRAAPTNQQSVE